LANRIPIVLAGTALTAGTTQLLAQEPALPATPNMGGPVELVEAPNGAIANKRILDCIEKVAWLDPTDEEVRQREAEALRQMASVSTGANNRAHLISQAQALEGKINLSPEAWTKVYLSAPPLDELVGGEEIDNTQGNAAEAARVLGLFDRHDPEQAFVVPPSTLVKGPM
jgi:hypothetical protein